MVSKGVFVQVDYTGRTGGKVFDTTLKEIGEKEGLEKRQYKPMLVKVGGGEVIKGIDEELLKMSAGEKRTVKIPPEKGYGPRTPKLVKLVPLKVFKNNNINPVPGMVLNLDNMPARIQSVSGGRVRVDFNHELAGKELEFDINLTKSLEDKEDIVKAIVERSLPEATAEVKESECVVMVKGMKKDYVARKAFVVNRILKMVDGIKSVKIEETYEKPTITVDEENE